LQTGKYPVYAIDQYWKRLQSQGNWYAVVPSMMIQRPSFSDIDQCFRDNRVYFT
jgi:hypothetical protein